MDNEALQHLWQQEVMASTHKTADPEGFEVEDLEIIQQNDLSNTDLNFGQMPLLFASNPTFAA
ncbi:MAG: hypothetical protein JXA52_06585 [Planctomycetes bacterium]|nr:hypothetical protein [Planctomycetota bacterium]